MVLKHSLGLNNGLQILHKTQNLLGQEPDLPVFGPYKSGISVLYIWTVLLAFSYGKTRISKPTDSKRQSDENLSPKFIDAEL